MYIDRGQTLNKSEGRGRKVNRPDIGPLRAIPHLYEFVMFKLDI